MGHRKKKRRAQGETELNLAAMLDMAFQLLTFFILTFKPAPVEGEVQLRMPPPQAVTQKASGPAGSADKDAPVGVETLTISVFSNAAGGIGTMGVGEAKFGSLAMLEDHVRRGLTEQSFEQVVVQVGSGLHYESLMKVIDICTRQKLKDGKELKKLSFVEVPDGG